MRKPWLGPHWLIVAVYVPTVITFGMSFSLLELVRFVTILVLTLSLGMRFGWYLHIRQSDERPLERADLGGLH